MSTQNLSFEEKAKLFVDQLVEQDGLDTGAVMHSKIEKRLILLLKEQDRDTRHGCAEAVNSLEDQNELCETNVRWIDGNDAHNACMNYQHGKNKFIF